MYILFSIISPVINKLTGTNLKITNEINLDKYMDVSNNKRYKNEEYFKKNEENINNIYINKIKTDISKNIENKGYILKNIDIISDKDYVINKINMEIDKEQEKNKDKDKDKLISENMENKGINREINCNIEEIENIEINNENNKNKDNEDKNKKDKNISDKEKKYLRKYLSENYNININNIFINE